jgi:hypothetical protein
VIRCDHAATVTVTDVATIAGDAPARRGKKRVKRTLALGSATIPVGANVQTPISVPLSSKSSRALLAALRRRERISVRSRLIAVDDVGNRTTAAASIRSLRA